MFNIPSSSITQYSTYLSGKWMSGNFGKPPYLVNLNNVLIIFSNFFINFKEKADDLEAKLNNNEKDVDILKA